MRTLACLMIASIALAAPVPKIVVLPDPLGRGYMGVYATLGDNRDTTLVIDRVVARSAADAAGLKAGDKFLQVGAMKPQSFDEVRELIGSLRPGTKVDLVVLRDKKEWKTSIVLMSRPPDFESGIIPDPEP